MYFIIFNTYYYKLPYPITSTNSKCMNFDRRLRSCVIIIRLLQLHSFTILVYYTFCARQTWSIQVPNQCTSAITITWSLVSRIYRCKRSIIFCCSWVIKNKLGVTIIIYECFVFVVRLNYLLRHF